MELSEKPLFISGNIHPAEGLVTKRSGREVANFGPVEKWDVVYSKQEAKVRVYNLPPFFSSFCAPFSLDNAVNKAQLF